MYDFLKPLEQQQYEMGKVDHNKKTKEMGEEAKKVLDNYPIDDSFTPFN